MWYVVKIDNEWKAVEYRGVYTDGIYGLLQRCELELGGQFGREEYALDAVNKLNEENK